MTRIGWVNYLNLLPLRVELEKLLVDQSIEIIDGVPSHINQLMRENEIDLSVSSSICLALDKENEIALPYGVASTGKVESVYWGANEKIDFARGNFSFHYTTHSQTSVALSKILQNMLFSNKNKEPSGKDIYLLIGDEALSKKNDFKEIIDLGEVWYNKTNLPFVYAIWQKRKSTVINPKITALITAATKTSAEKMKTTPQIYFEAAWLHLEKTNAKGLITEDILADYWTKIEYHISDTHKQGLDKFLAEYQHITS